MPGFCWLPDMAALQFGGGTLNGWLHQASSVCRDSVAALQDEVLLHLQPFHTLSALRKRGSRLQALSVVRGMKTLALPRLGSRRRGNDGCLFR